MVVLPEDSGPKISMTRPRGTPPTPSAASNEIEPVEMVETGATASLLPRRIIDPLPNCFSICESASSTARVRSSAATILLPCPVFCAFSQGKCANSAQILYEVEAILALKLRGAARANKNQKL